MRATPGADGSRCAAPSNRRSPSHSARVRGIWSSAALRKSLRVGATPLAPASSTTSDAKVQTSSAR
eukprot:9502521-Pyramimonas_sp.AAC.1